MLNKFFIKVIAIPLFCILLITVLVGLFMQNNMIDSTTETISNNFNNYVNEWIINKKVQDQRALQKVNSYISTYGYNKGKSFIANDKELINYNYISLISDFKTSQVKVANIKGNITYLKILSGYNNNDFKNDYSSNFQRQDSSLIYVSSLKSEQKNLIIILGTDMQPYIENYHGIKISFDQEDKGYRFEDSDKYPIAIASVSDDVISNTKIIVGVCSVSILIMAFIYFIFRKEIYSPIIRISDMASSDIKLNKFGNQTKFKYEFLKLQCSIQKLIKECNEISQGTNLQMNSITKINNKLTIQEKMLRTIFNISTQISVETSLSDMLHSILENAVNIIPNADGGNILLVDEEDEKIDQAYKDMKFKASVGYNAILKGAILKANQNHTYKQYEPNKSYIAKGWNCFGNSVINDNGINILLESGLNKIKASMVAPIIVNGQLCGMITLDSLKDVEAFDEDSKQLLDYLAIQLSIAVEHAKLINRIIFLSKYDKMTGIYNRHYFEELYELNYNRAVRYKETFCLVRFDIKEFAAINSTYGNYAGDNAIKSMAQIIKKDLRKTDLIGRIGEDEVAMLLINTSIDDAINKINIIKREIEKNPIKTHGQNIFINISAGYSYFPDSSKDIWELFTMADYERKRGEN